MRDGSDQEPRITAESIADRALISVTLRDDSHDTTPTLRPRSKPLARASGPVAGLVAEVERILGNRVDSTPAPEGRRESSHPPKRASVRPQRSD